MFRQPILKAIIAALAVAGFGTSACADDGRWTGSYLGGHLGGAWQNVDTQLSAGPGLAQGLIASLLMSGQVPEHTSQNGSAFAGGLSAGYSKQTGRFVYGVELDGTWTGLSRASNIVTSFSAPSVYTTIDVQTEWLATLRGRTGVLVTPSSLVYVTGGLAAGSVMSSLLVRIGTDCALNICAKGNGSSTLWGWTAGGGVAHALNERWSLKLEYLYYDLGSIGYSGYETSTVFMPFFGTEHFKARTDVKGQILRTGVNFNF